MKIIGKLLRFFIVCSLLLSCFAAWCAAEPLETIIQQQLTPLGSFKCNYSVAILSAKTGEAIYLANADQAVAPASNQKLVTTISAIATLGPEFEFTTILARRGEDYLVIGDGDPGFGDPELMNPITDTFDQWAITLRKSGVTKITGNVIFDDSIFDRQLCHPNWPGNQLGNWYAAPVSGLNLNDNCLDISVGFDAERKAQLIIAPAVEDLEVRPIWLKAKSPQTLISPAWESFNKLKVRVTLGSRSAGPAYFTVQDPTLFFANTLRNRFNAYGINIDGTVKFHKVRKANGEIPDGLTIVGKYHTPIFCAALRANRNSQNFFAECLIKRMGFDFSGKNSELAVGSWANGERAVKSFLEKELRISTNDLRFDDGSGLSRYNRVSANTIAKLLYFANQQSWKRSFMDTLAVAGQSGTLRKRLRGTPAAGRVYAKTGYISGVSALSGYVVNNRKEPEYIFSMLYNFSPTGKLWQVKSITDRICIELAKAVADPSGTTQCPPEPEPELETDDTQEDFE